MPLFSHMQIFGFQMRWPIFPDVIDSINSVGIDSTAVRGTRAPELAVGGDEQFIGKAAPSRSAG